MMADTRKFSKGIILYSINSPDSQSTSNYIVLYLYLVTYTRFD